MRVWIVNPFDNLPLEGYRPQRFWLMSAAFAAAGHDTTFWTADFSHATKAPRVLDASLPAPPFAVRLVSEPAYRKNVSLKRFYAHAVWARAWARAVRAEAPADLIVVSSPPLGIGRAVRRYAARTGARVIVDVMDAWPETFERVFPRVLLAPLRALARSNYRAASAITVVASRYADLVRASYGFTGATRLFYHGITLAPPCVRAPRAVGAPLRLVYAGNMGRTYALTAVVEAMTLLPEATLVVAGEGEQLAALKALASSRGLSARVTFTGYLASAALAQVLAAADIGIVPMADDSCVGVPYKFGDYAAAGLAIVSSLSGESAALLARYAAGATYAVADAASLAASVRALAPRLAEAQAGARHLAEEVFDAARIYRDYVRFAEEVVK